jgi:hypothetical protein
VQGFVGNQGTASAAGAQTGRTYAYSDLGSEAGGGFGGAGGGWGSTGSTGGTGTQSGGSGTGALTRVGGSGGGGGYAVSGNGNITWSATGTRLGAIS